MAQKNFEKKKKLGTKARQTRWAPVWAVLRKFGAGKMDTSEWKWNTKLE